jgi:hypothetical protein
MPDALLSSSPRRTPLTPSFSDRANLESKFLSADPSAGSGEKLSPSNSLSWKSQKSPATNTSLDSFGPASSTQTLIYAIPDANSKSQDMSATGANGDTRPNKVGSSTNNLFSSSCQPMRNTPNGESFAKV